MAIKILYKLFINRMLVEIIIKIIFLKKMLVEDFHISFYLFKAIVIVKDIIC